MAQHRHHKPKQAAAVYTAPTTSPRTTAESLVSASRKTTKVLETGIDLRDAKRTLLFVVLTLLAVAVLGGIEQRVDLGMKIGEPIRSFLQLGS